MYAIISTGGKQYKVSAGDEIFVEKIKGEAGEKVKFEHVLALGGYEEKDSEFKTGNPEIKDAYVDAEIVKQGKQKKIDVFKFKAKKGYRRKQGHRQPYTRVRINKITG